MKRFLFLSLFFTFSCLSASAAVTYCSASAFGYGRSATGGGSAAPVLVNSVSQLQSALNKGKNKVIIITQNLTFTKMLTVQDGSNVTLLGLPGVTLTSLQQDATNSGILYVKRFSNLIIRNLTFVGPGAYDCNGNDLLCFQDVTNAWVDHCDFQDGCDGNFDNKNGTDNVTVSWCRFRYLKKPKAGGSGGSDDHRYTNLLGSSPSDKPGDGIYNITWAYCWWDDGCKERMVRCRNCDLHFLNCYWNSSVANYYVGPENAKCYFEGCTFEGKANTKDKIFKSYGGTNACKFVDCAGNLPSNAGSVSAPTYSYTASAQAEAKTAVTNATCGAGATLTVTTAGAVSSTCDGSAPLPTVYTVTWDATTNGGTCGTATSSVTSGAAVGSLPEASKDGFNFDGWFTAPSGGTKISSATTVTGNVTYYAQFTSAPVTVYYTVIWDANGGTCATASSEIESGAAVGTLPVATKTGDYTFDGWYTAVNGGTKITASTVISGNVTYYAHYTATGGGGGGCETLAQGTQNSGHTAIDATIGTITTTGGQSQDNYIKLSGNSTQCFVVTAKTGYTITAGDKLTVTVYNKNSSAADIGFQINSIAHTVNLTGKTEGQVVYILQESDINAGTVTIKRNDSGDRYGAILLERCGGSTPPPASNFVLSYDENGGSGTMTDDEQTGANVTVRANGFTAPTGYAFEEWNTDMNGGGTTYAAGTAVTLTEDMTLYAIWTPQSYTVTLDADGGTGGSASVTATFDEALPNITVPTQSGYVFKGYYTEADGAGTQYYDENGSSTNNWTIPSATTLYAYWEVGSAPDPTGCDLHFWFIKADDATTNGKTNDATVFSGMVGNSSALSGNLTIDGKSYSVTGRSGDNATFGSFTIPSGKTGVFYALAVSSGSGDRQINLVCGPNTYELPVAGGSDSYKRIESEELPEGTYSIQREGSSNVRLGVVVVKICEALPPSDAPVISTQPVGATYCAGDAIISLSVTATGSGTLSYQWTKDGVNISGATSDTYTPSAAGVYICVVTNTEDGKSPMSLSSDEAEITILVPVKYTLTNAVSPAGYGTVDVASVDEILSGTATTSSSNTYTVNGTTVTATPAATTAEYSYAFDSWSGLPATITEDATVTAVFTRTAREYGVTLHTNDGTINSGDVTGYTFGIGATLPTDVTKTGADFGGWYDNSGLTGSAVTEIATTATGDKEYWAKWTTCPATNSGEVVYRFEVKSSKTSGNVCASVDTDYPMTTSNALSELIGGTLTARVSNTNRLQYSSGAFTYKNGEGGVLRVDLDCPIASGDVIRFINSATSSNYNAYVRHTSSSTSADQITLTEKNPTITSIAIPDAFIGQTTLYIVRGASNNALISYFEIIRACPILLDANTNGGKVGGENTKTLRGAIGDELALPHAFKDGHRFKGWFEAPSGGVAVSDPYTITGSTTLYAQFEDCPDNGLLYKFEVGTGLTDGAVTANGVDFEFNTSNYLTSLIGGTLTTGGSAASKVTITGNNAITITNNDAYLKIDLDCALEEGDIFRSTVSGNTVYVSKATSRTKTVELDLGTMVSTPIPAALVGEKTLYIWKGSGSSNALTYFEITRPRRTAITLDATGAYNSYTTSVTAILGNEMPEIRTLPMRVGYVFGGYYDAPNGAGTQYYNGLGEGVRNWDKDVATATLYAHWVAPCDMAPTLKTTVPTITIRDGQDVDMALVRLSCDFDTTGIQYVLQSASEAISGCTYKYEDERIYIQGRPALGNASTETRTITFTVANTCSPARTYTIDATIRIYPSGQKPKIAFIITGTEKASIAAGGDFSAYDTIASTACKDLLAYLKGFYDVTCVNGYATKDEAEIAAYYEQYDLLVVTDFLSTPKGYTNAIGTLIDKKPILSFEAYVAGENGKNWHIDSNPKDPSPKVQDMKILCAGHAIFGDAEGVDVLNEADTTVHVLSSLSTEGDAKGLQGFVINEAPDYIFLATIKDVDNNRNLIVCCERQIVFPARLMLYGINFYEMDNLSDAGRVVMHQMIDYLLMTDESKIADCSLVFDNGAGNNDFDPGAYSGTGTKGDGKWSTAANWFPGYNIVPTPYHPTRIIAECHVDNDYAHAGSVKVNQGKDALGHPVDGILIVEPNGGLTVAGMVAKVNDTRYASPTTIKAEDLLIKADETGNGSFVYGNKESDVRATVEYYSLGEKATSTNPVWQYIGIPFQAAKTAMSLYYAAWMCRWSSASDGALGGLWQWVDNNDVLMPFEGYCITQTAKKTYTFTGKLNAPVTTAIELDNCDADGYAFAANSWTAPIKIQEMQDDDFTNAEKAIYIYHSGTYADWTANGDPVSAKDGAVATLPGQYAVVPIHSSPYLAGADSVIPAMQGFFVKTTDSEAELKLVYNRVVYDAKYFKTSTQPMRAPQRVAQSGEPEVMILTVAGDSLGADRIHILSRGDFSQSYEDGWDGRKIEGDAIAPKLSVVKDCGEMAVAAIETPEGQYLSFRAGEDSIYTFSFDYEGETIYLYDRLADEAAEIRTGNTYTFRATNKTAAERFLITATPPRTPTQIETIGAEPHREDPEKIIHEGKLMILYQGAAYDALGTRTSIRKEAQR